MRGMRDGFKRGTHMHHRTRPTIGAIQAAAIATSIAHSTIVIDPAEPCARCGHPALQHDLDRTTLRPDQQAGGEGCLDGWDVETSGCECDQFVVHLIPTDVRTLPTRCLEQAVEKYSRAVRDVTPSAITRIDAERQRAILIDEWERVQDHVVDVMTTGFSAAPAGVRAACAWIVARVFATVDAQMQDQGCSVPRQQICRMFTDATPSTPVDVQ